LGGAGTGGTDTGAAGIYGKDPPGFIPWTGGGKDTDRNQTGNYDRDGKRPFIAIPEGGGVYSHLQSEGGVMNDETQKIILDGVTEVRELVIENTAAMRELRGEFREFKQNVSDRFRRDEERAGRQKRDRFTVIGIFISAALLTVNIIVNFFH
jgi:hypothetical protein